MLLDEIQYSKEWETEIKLLVDHRRNIHILAPGYSSVVHRKRLAESGVGRWITVPIPTLSFFEFVHIRGESFPSIRETLRPNDLFDFSPSEFIDLAERFGGVTPRLSAIPSCGRFSGNCHSAQYWAVPASPERRCG